MVPALVLFAVTAPAVGQWTLNDGTRMSFVFVNPSEKQAWRPSGETLPYTSLPRPTAPVWSARESEPVLVALMNPSRKLSNPPNIRFKLPATDELNSSFAVICNDRKIWMAGYKPTSHQPSMQDIAIGVANGSWKVLSWVEFRSSQRGVHAVKVHGAPLRLSVTGNFSGAAAKPLVFVNVPPSSELSNATYKFVVKSRNGLEMPYAGEFPTQGDKGGTTYRFVGQASEVSQVVLKVRSYEWHTLRVAHFRPNSG